nr:hypothetical protein B0A51_11908 [Rachicladosporium sp. CCFEE 5018]
MISSFLFPEDIAPPSYVNLVPRRPQRPTIRVVPTPASELRPCSPVRPSHARSPSAPASLNHTVPTHAKRPSLISLASISSISSTSSFTDVQPKRSGRIMRFKSLSLSKEGREKERMMKREDRDRKIREMELSPIVDEEFWRTGKYSAGDEGKGWGYGLSRDYEMHMLNWLRRQENIIDAHVRHFSDTLDTPIEPQDPPGNDDSNPRTATMVNTSIPTSAEMEGLIDQALDAKARVKIFTGDDIMAHSVPKALLISASPKFAEALAGDTESLTLKESIGAFRVVVGWLLKAAVVETEQRILAEAWVLASKYDMKPLQNAAMRALVSVWETHSISQSVVEVAYAYAGGDLLRKAAVVQTAHYYATQNDASFAIYIRLMDTHKNGEFMLDLLAEMRKSAVAGGNKGLTGAHGMLKRLHVYNSSAAGVGTTATKRASDDEAGANKRAALGGVKVLIMNAGQCESRSTHKAKTSLILEST